MGENPLFFLFFLAVLLEIHLHGLLAVKTSSSPFSLLVDALGSVACMHDITLPISVCSFTNFNYYYVHERSPPFALLLVSCGSGRACARV